MITSSKLYGNNDNEKELFSYVRYLCAWLKFCAYLFAKEYIWKIHILYINLFRKMWQANFFFCYFKFIHEKSSQIEIFSYIYLCACFLWKKMKKNSAGMRTNCGNYMNFIVNTME